MAQKSQGRRLTAAERAEAYLALAERLKNQVLPGDREKFTDLVQIAAAVAENGEGGLIITAHQLINWCYSDMDELRVRWQTHRLDELGQAWLKAKAAVTSRQRANEAFVTAGLQTKIDAWLKMPASRQKLSAGFELMDALRAPFGRCPECVKKGRRPNPLTARSGKVFPECYACHREKLKGLDDRPNATAAAVVPTAPTRQKTSHSKAARRHHGNPKAHAAERPMNRKKGKGRKGGGQKKK